MALAGVSVHVSGTVDRDSVVLGPDTTGDPPMGDAGVGTVVTTGELRIEAADGGVTIAPIGHTPTTVDPHTTYDVPPGGSVLTIQATDRTIGFDAAATVDGNPNGCVVSFPQPTRVRLTTPDSARPSITVPPTPTGAATAITIAGSQPLVRGPGRSHPTARPLPPRVRIGDTRTNPTALEGRSADRSATIEVPPDLPTVLQVAPLAYYLEAAVSVADTTTPTLSEAGDGPSQPLAPTPVRPASLLETLFRLDCRIRATTAPDSPIHDPMLEGSALDPQRLVSATPVERLHTYLDADTGALLEGEPSWHLAAYLDPGPDTIPAIPLVLDRLAVVYPPTAQPLSPQTLMERSLDDFYRSRRPTRTVDLVEPTLEPAGTHAWIADNVPVDAFRIPPQTVGHLDGVNPDSSPPLDVTLILNDPAMVGEEDTVAKSYRERSAVPVNLDRRRELTRDELVDALRTDVDLLHFVGHCEPSGLVCADGNLSVTEVESVEARTVFLNACGSYHEGAALVEAGTTAAAVTYRGVLDGQAETVGAAFARLVTRGFSMERTISLARRRVMMGMDYGIVGDGTHRLTAAVDPIRYVIDPTDDGFAVTCETFADGLIGDLVDVPLPGVTTPRFRGRAATCSLDRSGVQDLLERTTAPVIYDGTFAWPEDLVDALPPDHGA